MTALTPRLRWSAFLAASLLLVGCGSDEPEPAAADPPADAADTEDADEAGEPEPVAEEPEDDADGSEAASGGGPTCELLSPEAIERAIGISADAGRVDEQVSSERQVVCMYDLADGGYVQVLHVQGDDATRQRSTAETIGETPTEDATEFPDGYYAPEIGFIGAQAGDDYVQVALLTDAGEPTRDQLVALMQELLATP